MCPEESNKSALSESSEGRKNGLFRWSDLLYGDSDRSEAERDARKAAETGDPESMYNLARVLERAADPEHIPEEALDWMKKAADAGWAKAGIDLGNIYNSIAWECRSLEESEKYFRKAFDDPEYEIVARMDVASLYIQQGRYSEAVGLLEDGFGLYLGRISAELKKSGEFYQSKFLFSGGYIREYGWRIVCQMIGSDAESMSRMLDFIDSMEDDPRWIGILDLLKDMYPKNKKSIMGDMIGLYPYVSPALKKDILDFLGSRPADA